MKSLTKLNTDPSSLTCVLRALEYALDIGPWLTPEHFVPLNTSELIERLDHIGIPASIEFKSLVLEELSAAGAEIREFNSRVASIELGTDITIVQAKGLVVPLEILFSADKFVVPHIAFSLSKAHYIAYAMQDMEAVNMKTAMLGKNDAEEVSIVYMDGGPIRIELLYRKRK